MNFNLKNQLKLYMKLKDVTASTLSRRTGVSRQVLSQWLSGISPRKLDQLKSVATFLGTTVDNLAWGDGIDTKEKVGSSSLLKAFLQDDWISEKLEIKVRRLKN